MSKRLPVGNINAKRAYERPVAGDGTRVMVDRLRPRGVRKAGAAIDEWSKDPASDTALRKRFGHDPARWQEFRRRYAGGMHRHPEQLTRLQALARQGVTTLVYSAQDGRHNDAVAARDLLLGRLANRETPPPGSLARRRQQLVS